MKPCPETFPYPLIVLDETDSTNRYISQLCNNPQKAVAELTTVSAEFQTAGKGQRGNSWEAEKEKNLLFSFVLYPTFLEARCQFILSQIISLSIKEELDRWSDEITIKWPNDIYWRDKKICGILIENDLSGHFIGRCISGVGININQKEFHSDAPNPVSLKQITGKEHNRHEILAHILKRVQIYYNGLQTEERNTYAAEISARYARALFRRRGFHLYEDANGKFSARLLRARERGNNFSAGQRQLLSFARTILHKPSVMILDEATANIDTETELLIQDSLEKMRSVGTMLIVAHRLSTIQHADNIIVLSRGKILEQGTHQQLLAAHGRYYQLYTLQYHKEQMDKQ